MTNEGETQELPGRRSLQAFYGRKSKELRKAGFLTCACKDGRPCTKAGKIIRNGSLRLECKARGEELTIDETLCCDQAVQAKL